MADSASDSIFELTNLRIAYGFKTAVDGLSLTLARGRSLGLLGENGAGKTSTLRALLGMVKPRSGHVRIFGENPGTPRSFRRIGFAPEDGLPPEYLTAREYLRFIATLRKVRAEEVDRLLEGFELAPGKKIRDYSKGMKRRLLLCQAFLGAPELLILDEPLNGLDPLVIIKLREKLQEYVRQGGSAVYSSHILAEVEKTCSDIAIVSQGKLVYSGTLESTILEFGSVEAAFAAKAGKP